MSGAIEAKEGAIQMPNHSAKHSEAMLNHRKRMDQKKITAEINAEERAKRSPQDQIALLDKRLGKGLGAAKERTRLAAKMMAKAVDAANKK